MSHTLEDISATKKRLKIQIPAERVEAEIQKTFRELQQKSKFPGFRPGKAPMSMIEKKFGKDAEAEALEKLIPEFYQTVLMENEIIPVSKPEIEGTFEYKRNIPLELTVVVEIRPKVENLSYEDIPIKEIPVDVKDEDIDAALQRLAEEKATYEVVEDAIANGDLVTVDYTVKEDGTVTKDVVLKIGSGTYPQEFFDGLTGRKKDEEFDLEVAFPEDSQTQFAGKKVSFRITIKDIKRRNLAAIDDEFAKDLGMENLQALKEKARENIFNFKSSEADSIKQREILDKLLQAHEFEIPESLLNAELSGIINDIRASGKDERTDEALKEEFRENAVKSVKASVLLALIGEKEGIDVSEDDLKAEIVRVAQRFYITPENVMKYYVARDGSLEGLKNTVFEKKVLGLLLSKAKIEKGE